MSNQSKEQDSNPTVAKNAKNAISISTIRSRVESTAMNQPKDSTLKVVVPENFSEMIINYPHLMIQAKGYSQMQPALVLVTPEIAALWLDKNVKNRKSNFKTERSYSSQMEMDLWFLTHQGVAFDDEGNLQDGQHRLKAVVTSGKPQFMLVFNNVPKDNFTILDTGKTRRAADVLQISGIEVNPVAQSQIASFLLSKIKGHVGRAIQGTSQKESINTNQLILDLVNLHKQDFEEAAKVATEVNLKRKWLKNSVIGGYFFIFSKFISAEKAHEFMNLYSSGANLADGHPVLLLQTVLMKEFSKRKRDMPQLVGLFVTAWNHFIQGETKIEKLKFNPARMSFPEVLNEKGESIEDFLPSLFPALANMKLTTSDMAELASNQ